MTGAATTGIPADHECLHFEELATSAETLEQCIDEKVERAVEREVDEELAGRGR